METKGAGNHETTKSNGELNGITIHRLKDKLGTRALPTAELSMDGTLALLIGESGQGVKQMATLLNITRIYNAVAAVAQMRRLLALSRDYAGKRIVFGRKLLDQPLHLETFADLETSYRGCFSLTYAAVVLQGQLECSKTTKDQKALLRILIPLAKLFTARQAIALTSETIESFGGAGYVEDTHLPKWFRDVQVLSIWEGTTNVLSLDVLRAIRRDAALKPFLDAIGTMLAKVKAPILTESAVKVRLAMTTIAEFFHHVDNSNDPESVEAGAREIAFHLARTFAGAALLDHAEWALRSDRDPAAAIAARRWCAKNQETFTRRGVETRNDSKILVQGQAEVV